MATTTRDVIKVTKLTQHGFLAEGREKGIYYSKKFSDKTAVVPGAEFSAELYTSDGGAVYLNKILSQAVPSQAASKPVVEKAKAAVDTDAAKHFTPAYKKPEAPANGKENMSKAEWAQKDRSQLIGGLSHDAAALVASMIRVSADMTKPVDALKVYKEVLEGMLAIRAEVK